METPNAIIPLEGIERNILVIRGQRVMLHPDLALLFGVTNKRLKEQVRRNKDRFPEDFMFTLTTEETAEVAAVCGHLRGLKFASSLPFAFTEHGAVMLANVLNSPRAVQASIFVVRAFVRLKAALGIQKEMAVKLDELEKRCDARHRSVLDGLRKLLGPPVDEPRKAKIGFKPKE